jgi:CheY-like chemotaxis protein
MLAGLLLPLGFLVREAASGAECLESVLAHQPDAVLLDITMDDMDGWETARRIRARGISALPIIMVSANAFENQADKLAEVGAQAFVDKPVIESELLVALQKHLQIEWVAELHLAGWAAPAAPVLGGAVDDGSGVAAALPDDYTATLTRLARMGHAQGLHQALDRLVQAHPASGQHAAALRDLVERFAFTELLEQLDTLRSANDPDDAEAA